MTTPNAGEDAKKLGHRSIAGKNVNVAGTLENSLADSFKKKHVTVTRPSNYTPGHLSQKNENLSSYKNTNTNVCSSFIRSSTKLETTQIHR